MNLIITEKVDAASQVAEALFKIGQKGKDLLDSATKIKSKCNKKGFIESDNYIVVWTNGHTGVDLRPDKLNPSYGLKFKFDPNFDYKIPTLLSEMKRELNKY